MAIIEASVIDLRYVHTDEEIAAWLTFQEGKTVTVLEVRKIQAQALRKLHRELAARGLCDYEDLAP